MNYVNVQDFGAVGDGNTDCTSAFRQADTAANGRTIIVPSGTYKLNDTVTLNARVRFEGKVTMPADKPLILRGNFDYPHYLDAFENEELAFKKAFQALLSASDHESLDLCGRRVALTAPVDMRAAWGGGTRFAMRRVIRNGQIEAASSGAWATGQVQSSAYYSKSAPTTLSNVANAASIEVGSLVTGQGVGREIYVRAINVGAKTLTLSQPLYGAEGTQTFTFNRFRYLLDFSGFENLTHFIIDDIELQGSGRASAVMLPKEGAIFQIRDCFINKPKDRGLTSIGMACQGLMIDRCQFLSNEQSTAVKDRVSIGFNANGNDVKIRNNRVVRFKHFCVLAGNGHLITGNHWFHGDRSAGGTVLGGIVFTLPNCRSIITGNYIDNNYIEWTNEHDNTPAFSNQFSFGGLTITGNNFVTMDVAEWCKFIVIKPYGPGHYIHGLSVTGNVFRALNGTLNRVEGVDKTFADLDYSRMRNVVFDGNTFHNIRTFIANPAVVSFEQKSNSSNWMVPTAPILPFSSQAKVVEALTTIGPLRDATNRAHFGAPIIYPQQGADKRSVKLTWQKPVRGQVRMKVRMDNPN